jgi:hypothetical protein
MSGCGGERFAGSNVKNIGNIAKFRLSFLEQGAALHLNRFFWFCCVQ